MMKSILSLLLLLTAACENSVREAPQAAGAPVQAAAPAPDLWDRSRQCADHADRIAARFQKAAASDNRDLHVIEWNSHYNSRDAHCYMVITLFDPTAKEQKGYVPILKRQLYDAVEGLLIAEHTSQRLVDKMSQDMACRVPDPSGDRSTTGANCEAVHKLIVDRMTQ